MPCDFINSDALSSHPMGTRARAGIVKPSLKYANVISITNDAVLCRQIRIVDGVRQWMMSSMLFKEPTLELVSPHPSYNVFPNKLVHPIKHKDDGRIHYKDHLVTNVFPTTWP